MTHRETSYSPDDLSSSRNQVRLLIQDTSSTGALFSDTEVDFFVDNTPDVRSAARMAASSLKARYSSQVSKTVGKLRIQLSDKAKFYGELADEFKDLAKSGGSLQVFSGGISVSDKNTQDADTDRTDYDFKRGQFDLPNSITSSTDEG